MSIFHFEVAIEIADGFDDACPSEDPVLSSRVFMGHQGV